VKYRVDGGKLTVKARSSLHDTTTVWSKISGDGDADPDAIESARATFTVDMTVFDVGDWLRNRKLRKDFALDDHPRATFTLERVSDVQRDGAKFRAKASGQLRWRGKTVPLELAGEGTLDANRLAAHATFELDIRTLGLSAPRFLMFKVEDEVMVDVVIEGRAT
jgi:polyisoprenoid-binding protein YceI